MNQINLCFSKPEIHQHLGRELTQLGYQVVEARAAEGQRNDDLAIVDYYYLKNFPSHFSYPILFSDHVAEETMDSVNFHECMGIIDSTCKGYLLKSILEVCLARKREREQLIKENQKLNNKLQDRRIIEKAKFVLMKRLRTSEEEAYRRMRSRAMREQKSLREIADLILLHEE